MIELTSNIIIPDNELRVEFCQAAGPGGQNVNKVTTAVRLRFNIAASQALPPRIKERLLRRLNNSISNSGDLIVEARRQRYQLQNRRDAEQRLAKLLREALRRPRQRIKTRPSKAAVERRLAGKKRRGDLKKERRANFF